MKRLLPALVAILALLTARTAARADNAEIAPFITTTTVLVVRVDSTNLDLDAAETWRENLYTTASLPDDAKPQIAAALPLIHKACDALTQAGGKNAYLIGDMAFGVGAPIAIIVPLPAGADSSAISKLLVDSFNPMFDGTAQSATINNALVIASSAMLDKLKVAQPASRPEVTDALDAGAASPIAISFIPTFALKMLASQAAGAPPALLTSIQAIDWVTLAATLPPKENLHLVIHARNADAVQTLTANIQTAQDAMRKIPGHADLADALTPVVNSQTFTIDMDTPACEAKAVPAMVEGMKRAQQAKVIVASMSNMKQLLVGCFMFANDHQGQWPDKFDDLAQYVGNLKALTTNPSRPGVDAGYIYVKPAQPMPQLKSPATTAMIYEPADGDKDVCIGFADGHVERLAGAKAAEMLKDVKGQ